MARPKRWVVKSVGLTPKLWAKVEGYALHRGVSRSRAVRELLRIALEHVTLPASPKGGPTK